MELENLDVYYKTQANLYNLTRRFFLFDRKRAIAKLQIKKGDIIFDFACGTGLNIPIIMKSGAEAMGIDYSKSLLDVARKNYPSAQFVQGDISKCAFPNKANGIICTYAISMVEAWELSIINMKKHLMDNGRLVILDFHHPWKALGQFIYPSFQWWLHKHEVYPEKQILSFVQRHFIDVECEVKHFGYSQIITARNPIL